MIRRLPPDATPPRRPPAPRPLPRFPHCKGCGTAVKPGDDYCPACKDTRGASPTFLMNIKAQKRPPYESSGAVNPGEERNRAE